MPALKQFTDAELRAHRAAYQRAKRARWALQGLCIECGRERRYPTVHCPLCYQGNVIRVDRAIFKKRMAKAGLR